MWRGLLITAPGCRGTQDSVDLHARRAGMSIACCSRLSEAISATISKNSDQMGETNLCHKTQTGRSYGLATGWIRTRDLEEDSLHSLKNKQTRRLRSM